MNPNPFLGVMLYALGGFAAGSFYIPFKRVRQWSWESHWIVVGVFSWIAAPWVVAAVACPNYLWCLTLNVRHRSGGDYLNGHGASPSSRHFSSLSPQCGEWMSRSVAEELSLRQAVMDLSRCSRASPGMP